MGERIQRRVFVSGRVQGVSFRAQTHLEAQRIGRELGRLGGFVRNLPDGRVEAVFQGERRAVEAMLEWCRRGPKAARVTALEARDEPLDPGLPDFEVRTS